MTDSMKKNIPFIILGTFIVFLTLIPSLYFYNKYQEANKKLITGEKDDVAALVAQVSKHVLLPTGETPTVMTVTDKEKSTSKQFFANAKTGDKVLVYMIAKKAFLYDTVADRILEIGPVLTDGTSSATMGQATPTPTGKEGGYRFILYNGTSTVGLTKKYVPIVEDTIAGADVIDTDNAATNDYETSRVVDLKGTRKTDVETIAKALGIATGSLPVGETASDSADFLIIFGKDKI